MKEKIFYCCWIEIDMVWEFSTFKFSYIVWPINVVYIIFFIFLISILSFIVFDIFSGFEI
jgi:hypothetical protein